MITGNEANQALGKEGFQTRRLLHKSEVYVLRLLDGVLFFSSQHMRDLKKF